MSAVDVPSRTCPGRRMRCLGGCKRPRKRARREPPSRSCTCPAAGLIDTVMMGCTGGVMKAKFTKGRDEALQGGRLAMGRTLTTFSALQPDVCHRLSAECRVIDEFVATCDRAIPARTQPDTATQRLLEAVVAC